MEAISQRAIEGDCYARNHALLRLLTKPRETFKINSFAEIRHKYLLTTNEAF